MWDANIGAIGSPPPAITYVPDVQNFPMETYSFGGHVWRVLDVQNDRKLLLSEHIIEMRPFNCSSRFGEDAMWATSDIRHYLNSDFLVNTFTASEQARILQTVVSNGGNPWFGSSVGANTRDHIFLLSLEEVVKFFGDSGQLANQNNPNRDSLGFHDQFSDNRVARVTPGGFPVHDWPGVRFDDSLSYWWWLRSPGIFSTDVATVSGVGVIHSRAVGDMMVTDEGLEGFVGVGGRNSISFGGIRPALWLYLPDEVITDRQLSTANPTTATVQVNSQSVNFQAYTINDRNFFMLREIAYALNGTSAQFSINWDGARNAIILETGQPYHPDGSEFQGLSTEIAIPNQTTSVIYLNGEPISPIAYNIGGRNFFMLRDLGDILGFGVDWDGATNTILISTN